MNDNSTSAHHDIWMSSERHRHVAFDHFHWDVRVVMHPERQRIRRMSEISSTSAPAVKEQALVSNRRPS
jgi:hypothetical protein